MKFSSAKSIKSLKSGVPVIVPVFFRKKKFLKTGQRSFDAAVEQALKMKVFEGHTGETHTDKNISFVAFGDPLKLKPSKVLNNTAQGLKTAKKERGDAVAFFLPDELAPFGQEIAEALALANYDPAKYKTGKEAKKIAEHDIQSCVFIGKVSKTFLEAAKKGGEIADAVIFTRDLVNGPPNIVTTEYIENEARKIAKESGYKIQVFKKKELEKMGMNAILAVNRGSEHEARLIMLEYVPKNAHTAAQTKEAVKEAAQPVVLVGKGIVFDSGGYNLKPSGYIEDMHLDMAGAAAVLGVFKLLKKLNVQCPVTALLPITENCIDSVSYKPSEIITTYAGKTVEITNTDAEGRLVLCDPLAYAVKNLNPRYIIDIATLTGACMIALGEQYAGLFGTDKELLKLLRNAGNATDELLWPLPLHPEFDAAMKGEISDLKNSEGGKFAGASKGAAFLKVFVGKAKWAHLDIAGTAYIETPKKYAPKRGTGFGVRLFMKFFEYANRH